MTINCQFPAGSGRAEILDAFQEKLLPAAEKVKPELVLISAGFDSREGDPLGNFLLTDTDFADLTRLMREIADEYAGGRLVSVLEGGYSLPGLAAGGWGPRQEPSVDACYGSRHCPRPLALDFVERAMRLRREVPAAMF